MKSTKRYSKSEYIAAVMWYEGISRKEAAQRVKAAIKGGIFGVLNNIVYRYHVVNSFTDPHMRYEATA